MKEVVLKAKERQMAIGLRQSSLARDEALLRELRRHYLKAVSQPAVPVLTETSSREVVRRILSSLGPPSTHVAPMSEDISIMGHLVAEVSEAAEKNVISESEADAVIDFLVGRFVQRRVDDALRCVFTPGHGRWFLAAASLKQRYRVSETE